MNLAKAVQNAKIRKGVSDGVSPEGAYWTVVLDSDNLNIRHYRSGAVSLHVNIYQDGWYGWRASSVDLESIHTVEDLQTIFAGERLAGNSKNGIYEGACERLQDLGLPWATPSPDDEDQDLTDSE